MQPPLLPEEALARVLRLARADGTGVLMVATFFALTSAAMGDFWGAVVWLLMAGAGAIELHGGTLLRDAEPRGLNWLIASQFLLLLVVLGYCALRLAHFDLAPIREALTDEMRASLREANYAEEDFLRIVYVTTYVAMGAVTLLYKSAVAFYFFRRRGTVAAALETSE
jgi:hypothetical protein